MNGDAVGSSEITDIAIAELSRSPAIAIAVCIMWLCGVIISFAFIDNNANFNNENNRKPWVFNLALGFLPTSIVMILYHALCHREMLSTLEGLNQSALPSALILSGISCVGLVAKAFKQ